MSFRFLIVLVIAVIFSLGCKSKHSNHSDEDIFSDSDNSGDSDVFSDIDTIEDSDAVLDNDFVDDVETADDDNVVISDPDIAEPDETLDENDTETLDSDIIDADATDEEIPDPDTADEISTDTDSADDIVIPDEDTADPDVVVFDEDYMTDDEIVANCADGMCDIPAGQFTMGCALTDLDCNSDETPRHSVILSSYKIMKNEVTVSEYEACVTAGNCNNSTPTQIHYAVWSNTTNYMYCNLGSSRESSQPMNCVSWYGAKAYCEWLGMRLPTEAEWEYAAKGNDDRIYPWGDTDATCDYAVMKEAGFLGCGTGTTWVVGSKTAGDSPFGASDMSGNLREWCNDSYSATYYSVSPQINPQGPASGSYKVLRGGSWYRNKIDLRASSRYFSSSADNLLDSFGFRCVAK
ncbi:MAG TPA: SUMF1/EgtB/PvdO family nonheme iron enzyme [bacterium]|nr:SUMF1/EgtB/PvdO family nonheme iron enzyme [bacterium]HPS30502.1 SUMF1/EgtB/PvdO family nonheme iron enzyme [bacterium]